MTTFKNKIGAADIKHYDGVNRTFGRTTSSGGTLTQAKVGNIVDVLQAYGDGATPSEGALLDAIQYIGANERTLELAPGTWPITANLTMPSTITLLLRRGAVLSVDAGVTLNLSNCYVIPEVGTGWYTGAGTVTQGTTGEGTVRVSATDTTPGTLLEKLSVVNLSYSVVNPGGDETYQISAAAPGLSLVSADDNNAGYLDGKLVAGAGVTLTVGSPAGNETLSIAAPTAGKVSANDTTAGYLNGKLVAGTNVTLTENNDAGNETLTIAAAIPGTWASAANTTATSITNVAGGFVTCETLDLGTPGTGEVYMVSGSLAATKGATGGLSALMLTRTGSATALYAFEGAVSVATQLNAFDVAANAAFYVNVTGILKVTVGGTLTVVLDAASDGSNSTASQATLTAIRIK